MAPVPLKTFQKSPDAVLDYAIRWTTWLAARGDRIASVVWTPPSGIAVATTTFGSGVAYAWVSGGTAGETYDVVCTITTAQGRTDSRTLRFVIVQR